MITFFLAGFTQSYSQFTISSNHVTQPGDVFFRTALDTAGFYPGSAGFNIWDFTGLNILGADPYPTSVYSANSSSCNVDSITMKFTNPLYGGSISYSYLDNSILQYSGSCSGQGSNWHYVTYSDSRKYFDFPFNFNQFMADTAYGHVFSNFSPGFHEDRKEYSTVYYDAFGELRMPWATYLNTARITRTILIRDSLTNATFPGEFSVTRWQELEWYYENGHGPLLKYQIYSDTVYFTNGTIQVSNWKQLFALTSSFVDINEMNDLEIDPIVYPIPASDYITVKAPAFISNDPNTKITIRDLLGKEIMTINHVNSLGLIQIDVSKWHSGVYLLLLQSKHKTHTSKIIVDGK